MSFRPSVYRVCVRILRRRYWKWEIPPSMDELIAILRNEEKKLWRKEGIKKPNHQEAYHAARVFLELKRERSGPVPRNDAEWLEAEGMMRRDRSASGTRKARPRSPGCNAGDEGRSPLGGARRRPMKCGSRRSEGWRTAEVAAMHNGAAGTRFDVFGPSHGEVAARRMSRAPRKPSTMKGVGEKSPARAMTAAIVPVQFPRADDQPFPRGGCLGLRSGSGARFRRIMVG